MEVRESIFKRRSVRKYKDIKVSKEIIQDLLECAMAAPSACNKKPWEFYVFENEEMLEKIKTVSRFAKFNSPLCIMVAGNTDYTLTKEPNDFWIQDCSAAIENIMLCATSHNLGTCWCGMYPMQGPVKRAREILNLGENIIPLGLIHIGYSDQELEARTQYDETRVHIY